MRIANHGLRARPLSWIAVALSVAACGGDVPGACERPPLQTLVFFDQSASSVTDGPTAAMYRDTLSALVDGALPCKGDAVRAFLVHGNTRGKVDRIDVVNTVEPPDTVDESSTRVALEKARYEEQIDSLRKDGRQRLAGLFDGAVQPQFKQRTDMLGALEVVSDELGQVDSATARVYFLGDMHESMPAPRRNFDAHRPANRAEAEAWADADTALLGSMSVQRERLRGIEVRVLLGNLANKPGAPEVRFYWERLLANIGVDRSRIRYN